MRKIILSLSILLACIISASAQNTVSFDNQSGQPALVKLVGPTSSEIEVPDGTKQSVQASAGKYVIKVRYGVQGKYHYTKGEEFDVKETATTTSKITITLHKVVNGNYDSRPINEAEFGVADPTAVSPSRDTRENQSKEIHDAAGKGDLEKVKTLLKENPTLVFSKDDSDWTPLHVAAANGHKDIVELLLAKGADLKAKDKSDYTPLHRAAEMWGVTRYFGNESGDTPLRRAAERGCKDVVKLLLAKGAEVNAKGAGFATPLHAATSFKGSNKEMVELLLDKGADVNAKDGSLQRPLHNTAYNGQNDAVELLLAKGAEVNIEDGSGRTPLYDAAEEGHKDTVALLLAKGADINTADWSGDTPLHISAKRGYKDVAELLLAKGSNVNRRAGNGFTPLTWAAYYGHKDVAALLLSKGADVNSEDKHGGTPLFWAENTNNKDVETLLRQHGGHE